MATLANLCRMTTTTTGTGTITLGSAVSGFLAFGSGLDGKTVTYAIKDGSNSEIGRGVYTHSGTTLTRASILASTNANAAINLSGSAEVFITAAAEDFTDLANSASNGRLTLVTATPVMTTTVTAQTTLYYTPYIGNRIALYSGSEWSVYSFTERSISLSGLTANTNYDCFIYDNAGTLTLELVAWTNDTTRATALVYQDGVLVKSGTATKRYLGSIRINAAGGQCDFNFGGAANGGGGISFGVWNAHNRVPTMGVSLETTNSWTYNSSTWRGLNNNAAGNFARAIIGVAGDYNQCAMSQYFNANATATANISVGIGSTTPVGPRVACQYTGSTLSQFGSVVSGGTWTGWSYFLPLEASSGAVSVTYYGLDNAAQSGITATFLL